MEEARVALGGNVMEIRVLYLGGSRAQAGCAEETLALPDMARLRDAVAAVCARHPRLAPLVPSCRWARNLEFADAEQALAPGDEVALLPPVSGGAPLAELTQRAIDPAAVMQRVQGPDAGAIVVFVGTVRNQSRGHAVTDLQYEAYEPMAVRQLERIAAEASTGARVAITHRTGRLSVGEIAVVIAAASPHRDAAFAACRATIERIKTDVPIWKQERTDDGQSWVGWGGG